MKKWIWALGPVFAVVVAGCNAGSTPTETYETPKGEKGKDPMTQSLDQNSGIPDVAKQALGGGKK